MELGRRAVPVLPSARSASAPLTVTGAASFEILVPPPADGSTRARLGRLTLPHGVVETPQFMPVGTNATVKALHPDEVAAAGASIILANTYHLYLRPGHERIERLGGLHAFMGWDRPILTDSGGYQVVSLGDLRVIDDDGVTFKSHLDGSIHRFTPEHSIAVQQALGPGHRGRLRPAGVPELAAGGRRSTPCAGRIAGPSDRSPRTPAPTRRCSGSSRAASTPGLRAESARFIAGLPFDGINIGGLAGDETPEERNADLEDTVRHLDGDPRPRYLMGLGSPLDLLDAVHRGIDLFDSVLPARVARNGQLWVPGGRLNLRNEQFRDDPRPVQDDCPCPLCSRFSRAYLSHLFRAKEMLAYRLATCHNLTFTLDFMAEDPGCAARRNLPRRDRRTAPPRRPDEWR